MTPHLSPHVLNPTCRLRHGAQGGAGQAHGKGHGPRLQGTLSAAEGGIVRDAHSGHLGSLLGAHLFHECSMPLYVWRQHVRCSVPARPLLNPGCCAGGIARDGACPSLVSAAPPWHLGQTRFVRLHDLITFECKLALTPINLTYHPRHPLTRPSCPPHCPPPLHQTPPPSWPAPVLAGPCAC